MESSAKIRFVLAGTVKQARCLPHAGIAHLVERHLAKVEVASSSLVARSSSEIPTTVPFPAPPKTTLWWEFPRFQPRFSPLDSRLIFTGDGFTGAAAPFMSGEKFLNFFQKGVDFFGKFAYNTM